MKVARHHILTNIEKNVYYLYSFNNWILCSHLESKETINNLSIGTTSPQHLKSDAAHTIPSSSYGIHFICRPLSKIEHEKYGDHIKATICCFDNYQPKINIYQWRKTCVSSVIGPGATEDKFSSVILSKKYSSNQNSFAFSYTGFFYLFSCSKAAII